MKMRLLLVTTALLLFVLSCSVGVRADSTASLDMEWSAATFSGPIAASFLPPPVGPNYLELAYAAGVDTQEVRVGTWAPITVTASPGSGASATTTIGSDFTTLASHTAGSGPANGGFQRWGSISTTTGAIQISIPYSYSIDETKNYSGLFDDGVVLPEITLWDSTGTVIANDPLSFVGIPGKSSGSGTLTLTDNGLTPGTYYFIVSGAVNVFATTTPEPSTISLLGLCVLGLAGLSLRRRFA